MKYAEKIDYYMAAKHVRLMLFGIEDYYLDSDAKCILSLNGKRAKKIWESLRFARPGLDVTSSPFCLMHDDCSDCGYAIEHGFCEENGSSSIMDYIFEYSIQIPIILSIEFYDKLWNQLDEL